VVNNTMLDQVSNRLAEVLFPGTDNKTPVQARANTNRVKKLFASAGVHCGKVLHAFRHSGVINAQYKG
jgi:hypothetical protein